MQVDRLVKPSVSWPCEWRQGLEVSAANSIQFLTQLGKDGEAKLDASKRRTMEGARVVHDWTRTFQQRSS
jgi:hypothetical protein